MALTKMVAPEALHDRLRNDLIRWPSPNGPEEALREAADALSTLTDAEQRVRIRHVLAQYHSLQTNFTLAHQILDLADNESESDECLLPMTAYARATILYKER